MPKKVVIDRSKWLNWSTRYSLGPSMLLDTHGNMCCLGFVCEAEGVKPADMLLRVTPRWLETAPKALSSDGQSTTLTEDAMIYNDDPGFSILGREKALQNIFTNHGKYELEFVGEYPSEHASSNT